MIPAGPQLQALDRSVPCRTGTANSGSERSPPDPHRKLRIKGFPAGPRPQRISEDITRNVRRYARKYIRARNDGKCHGGYHFRSKIFLNAEHQDLHKLLQKKTWHYPTLANPFPCRSHMFRKVSEWTSCFCHSFCIEQEWHPTL